MRIPPDGGDPTPAPDAPPRDRSDVLERVRRFQEDCPPLSLAGQLRALVEAGVRIRPADPLTADVLELLLVDHLGPDDQYDQEAIRLAGVKAQDALAGVGGRPWHEWTSVVSACVRRLTRVAFGGWYGEGSRPPQT